MHGKINELQSVVEAGLDGASKALVRLSPQWNRADHDWPDWALRRLWTWPRCALGPRFWGLKVCPKHLKKSFCVPPDSPHQCTALSDLAILVHRRIHRDLGILRRHLQARGTGMSHIQKMKVVQKTLRR